jgi:hypothetical protein
MTTIAGNWLCDQYDGTVPVTVLYPNLLLTVRGAVATRETFTITPCYLAYKVQEPSKNIHVIPFRFTALVRVARSGVSRL